MYRFVGIPLLLFLVSGGIAHAQFTSNDPLSITISPDYPRPYQVIQVTVGSTLIDLNSSQTTISVNGKKITSYTGTETVPVSVGGPGQATVIAVTTTIGGKSYKKSLMVTPSDVSLIEEPVSTAYPFYEGGLQLASQGRVRLIALPDLRNSKGTRLNSSTLVYTWKFGDQVLQADSGLGKNVLVATGPIRYRDDRITVTVTTPDSSLVASASTQLSPVDPIIKIYPYDPLLGTDFSNALGGSITMQNAEQSFRGVSYFFASTPELSWGVNGQSSGGDQVVTVRSSGATSGRANLTLAARLADLHQSVTANLAIVFGTGGKTNIFGF